MYHKEVATTGTLNIVRLSSTSLVYVSYLETRIRHRADLPLKHCLFWHKLDFKPLQHWIHTALL